MDTAATTASLFIATQSLLPSRGVRDALVLGGVVTTSGTGPLSELLWSVGCTARQRSDARPIGVSTDARKEEPASSYIAVCKLCNVISRLS